ncbi:nucleotidyltransferase family protein [Candidatus Woesearchaeota archaeon]|nr:nucleotidyltransferase family protein [Candidatus Woesearchaeota archaeon]
MAQKKETAILTLSDIKKKAVPILKKNDIVKAGVFGSYARGEAKKKSDIDFLIKIKGKKSLLDIVGIQLDLQEVLKRKIDLLEYEEVHPRLKKQIFDEEVRIL